MALINFVLLKEKFSKLEEKLDRLLSLNDYLIEEYSLNTFTSKLSRQQLFRLSEDLPEIHSWENECFQQKKFELREKYNLSSNDLTRAINIIKSNYEFMYNLGSRLPLQGVDEYNLIWFLDFWMEINPEIKTRNESSGFINIDINSIMESQKKEQTAKIKFWSELNGQLTPEVLAGLKALFYFARDKKFSETYIHTYRIELKGAKLYSREGIDGIKESFMHLARKENFFDNLVISLYFLHHGELAEELIEIYGVDEAFNWLDKAKSSSMFALPEFAGYKKI